jgi:hypothetical protein
VRVLKTSGNTHLAFKSSNEHIVRREFGTYDLQSDIPTHSWIVGDEDNAHTATAQFAKHFIATDPFPAHRMNGKPLRRTRMPHAH